MDAQYQKKNQDKIRGQALGIPEQYFQLSRILWILLIAGEHRINLEGKKEQCWVLSRKVIYGKQNLN